VGFSKYLPVRVYAAIVGHFMRMYDWRVSQQVKHWIANSINVQKRIRKFYRKGSVVIYPPVDVGGIVNKTKNLSKGNYFLIVSRLVGAKGLEDAAVAARKCGFNLKIVGESQGFSEVASKLKKLSGGNVQLVGRVEDSRLYELYGRAKGFIALARNEDFGITPVEAMASGTPVIAFNGGGFKETVVEGKTGVLIDDTGSDTIADAVERVLKTDWDKKTLQDRAREFSKEKFINEFGGYLKKHA
jgi:glycosyltransferase involved in cell wall biosynthesis